MKGCTDYQMIETEETQNTIAFLSSKKFFQLSTTIISVIFFKTGGEVKGGGGVFKF